MENKEKKEYGGCLSVLLPLWIIHQILTIIYNFAFVGFYTDFLLIPIILIGTNILALVGIILLLQFKKIGFYIFILTFVITFFVGAFFPDYVGDNTIFRSIFGLGMFLLLMSLKNNETKLNGYQTLGISNSYEKTEDFVSNEQDTMENVSANFNDEIITTKISNEVATPNESNNQRIESENIKKKTKEMIIDNNSVEIKPEFSFNMKKFTYVIIPMILTISIVVIFVLATKDNRSDQEIYMDAKKYIDKKEYFKGVKELNKIKDSYMPAKSFLGHLYYFNDVVGLDKELGESFLWEAFEANDSNACHTLWDIYYEIGEWNTLYKIATKISEFGGNRGPRIMAWLYFTDELGGKKMSRLIIKKLNFMHSK